MSAAALIPSIAPSDHFVPDAGDYFLINELLDSKSHRSLLPLDNLDMQNSKYVDDFQIRFSL